MSQEFTVRDIIEGVEKLPAAPRILPKLQGLLRDPNSTLEDVTKLLKLDTALAAQVVKLSNSAYYATATPVSDINAAVNRVGFYQVFRLVGIVASQDILTGKLTLYNMESGDLWKRSIAAATLMTMLSELIGGESDATYTIGLLHGLGKIVIDTFYAEQGIQYEMSGLRSVTPDEEYAALGFTHAEVAGALLSQWNFLTEIATPIEYQLNPASAPEDHRKMTILLHLTLQVVEQMEDNPEGVYDEFDPDPDFLAELGLTTDDFINNAERAEEITQQLVGSIESKAD